MTVLQQINDLKPLVSDIEQEIDSLPGELQQDVVESVRELREAVNNSANLIEKYYNDERLLLLMQNDLDQRMDEDPLYTGIPQDKRKQITEKIVEDDDVNLIDMDELKEFILDRLKQGTPEDLVKQSYSKNDIISLGDALEPNRTEESILYETGLAKLLEIVETPVGREDALAHGVKRNIEDPKLRNNYLYLYYGV